MGRACAGVSAGVPRARRLAGALAVAWASTIAIPARAALDPSAAMADVEALRARDAYSFCEDPRLPLSSRALALCPDAAEIAACAGFASACRAASEGRDPCGGPSAPSARASQRPAWVGGLARAVRGVATAAIWLCVVGLGIALLAPAWAALRRSRSDRTLRDEVSRRRAIDPRRERTDRAPLGEGALLARADRCAAAGEGVLALQLYLGASLIALDRRGAIRVAEGRTNGEYVNDCADDDDRRRLREIVREVERAQFGRYDVTPPVVEAVSRHARTVVRERPSLSALATVSALALSAIVLCACGRGDSACHRPAQPGDDPAGFELFYGVLRRQNVHVEPLEQSLASLAPATPHDPHRAPTVVVDLERTPLDDETQEHLVQWVRSGGELVLAGLPDAWPREFGLVATNVDGSRSAVVRGSTTPDCRVKGTSASLCAKEVLAHLASGAAFDFSGGRHGVVASFEDGSIYAAHVPLGRGRLLAIASDELLTNAGLSRADNAAAMVLLMSHADPVDLRVAEPHHGVAPPSTPWTALTRAGLGLGLLHALLASAVLFLAAGRRLARPRPAAAPRRRRFIEHVRAVGALYARTGNAAHALSAYAQFAEERLRVRMPRGTSDIPEFLASRSEQSVERCRALWTRALAARGGGPSAGDELAVLRDLSVLYAAAIAQDR